MPIKRKPKTKEEKARPKILLTCIFKDDSEYELAKRMLESFMPQMSGLAVAINGLSGKHQKLQKLIKKHGGQIVFTEPTKYPDIYSKDKNGKWFFSNFAAARNVTFDLAEKMQVEGKYDYWSWADKDDVLLSGDELLDVAQAALEKKIDAVQFVYWYQVKQDKQGRIVDIQIDHYRERLLRPGMFKWKSRLHEVALPKDDSANPRITMYEVDSKHNQKCVWLHQPAPNHGDQQEPRNIAILEVQIEEEKYKDPRTVFYLGKAYQDYARSHTDHREYLEKATKLFEMYLSGPNPSGWEEERANAWEYLGNLAMEKKEFEKATDYYLKGIKEYPQSHTLNLLLAHSYFERRLIAKGKHWLNIAVSMDIPKAKATIGTPHEIKKLSASLKYNEAMLEDRFKDALYWLEIKNKLEGIENDKMEVLLRDGIETNNASLWLFNYAKWLNKKGHIDKIVKLLDAVAPEMQNEQFVSYIANEVIPPKVWPSKSVVYFAGPTFEPWSPKSLHKGLGGSETAIVELSKRWAALGYKVTVFCDCREDEGEYDGVIYKQWQKMNWNDQFYIFIVWRSPQLLDKDINAFRLFYDAHDIEAQTNWTPDRMDKIEKVFFKSNWHRQHVPKLPEDKAIIISNGINV